MKYRFWDNKGRCPAAKEVEKTLKNDIHGRRAFKSKLEVFFRRTRQQLVSSRVLTPLRKSPNKVQKWSFDLHPGRTARMYCIIHEGCAWFLHFIIKKSRKGKSTPQKEIDVAEERAAQCWDNLKNRIS